ncbi:peptidylprolyl isomerase, partial [bacterium]|nr:peptidylprolyl isomerase [bacterium]
MLLLTLVAAVVLSVPATARAETKLEVTGAPRKAEVALGENIEVDVTVKNAGTEEAELLELVDDARSVSLEIKLDDATSPGWDTKFYIEEKFGDIPLKPIARVKLKPGEEAKLKEPLKVPAIAAGTWSITAVYAGTSPEKKFLAEISSQAALVTKKSAAATVKVLAGPKGETEAVAKVTTTHGTMTFRFFPKQALCSVLNFVRLAQSGWYDGKSFHRISAGAGVVQGGAPKSDGMGSFDYTIPLEAGVSHEKGRVGMARRSEPNTANCQFYVCSNDDCRNLNRRTPGYAIFAEV